MIYAFVIIIILIMIYFLKITIHFQFQHQGAHNEFFVIVKCLFIRYRFEVPAIAVDEETASIVMKEKEALNNEETSPLKKEKITLTEIFHSIEKFKNLLDDVVRLYLIVERFLKKVEVKKFNWSSTIGTGDAAQTGTMVGAFWGVKFGILALIDRYMKIKTTPHIAVHPIFQVKVSQTRIVCIIQFRIGHAIIMGLQILRHGRGIMKGFNL